MSIGLSTITRHSQFHLFVPTLFLMSNRSSVVLCSPTDTRIISELLKKGYSVQWAAVRMCLSEMMDPPQEGVLPSEMPTNTIPTCQGYSLTSVSVPPMILVALLTSPQLQFSTGFGSSGQLGSHGNTRTRFKA